MDLQKIINRRDDALASKGFEVAKMFCREAIDAGELPEFARSFWGMVVALDAEDNSAAKLEALVQGAIQKLSTEERIALRDYHVKQAAEAVAVDG